MTRDEADKADMALKAAGELGMPRLYNFDRINDNANNLALRVVVHSPAGNEAVGVMAKGAVRRLLTETLGREPEENEIIIKNQTLPSQTAGRGM